MTHNNDTWQYNPSDDVNVYIVKRLGVKGKPYYVVATAIRHQHRCIAYTDSKRAIMMYRSLVRLLRCNVNKITPQLQRAFNKHFRQTL